MVLAFPKKGFDRSAPEKEVAKSSGSKQANRQGIGWLRILEDFTRSYRKRTYSKTNNNRAGRRVQKLTSGAFALPVWLALF
jgi:hypothetical protein